MAEWIAVVVLGVAVAAYAVVAAVFIRQSRKYPEPPMRKVSDG